MVGDADDILRAVQIRHLFSGDGTWWDLTLPMIGLPDPYISPWSRLVDLPYLTVAGTLKPLLGQEHAVSASFLLVPPILLGFYSLLVSQIWRRTLLFRQLPNRARIVIATLTMVLAIYEFTPGRIDHHNMQLLALLGICAGVCRWNWTGGIVAGFSTVISVAIGLEGLPIISVLFLGIVAAVLFGYRQGTKVLLATSTTILLVAVPVAFVLIGPSGLTSTQCDSFSSPYVVLLIGCAACLLVMAKISESKPSLPKMLGVVLLGLIMLGR